MKVAIAQITPATDKAANRTKMQHYTEEAAFQKADLIVFPELVLSGYNCGDRFFEVAEKIPEGESTQFFSQLAKKLNIHIIWGMPETSLPGLLYNAAAFVGPAGFIGSWRKNALPGHATNRTGPGAFPDRRFFKNGSGLEVFDSKIGRVGCLICYDIFYPELARLLTLKGADFLVGISGSPSFEKDIFEPLVKARAMENTIDFVYTNLVGKEAETSYCGGGVVYGAGDVRTKVPGKLVAKADYETEGITVAEINPRDKSIRAFFPVLRDLTSEMYRELEIAHKCLT